MFDVKKYTADEINFLASAKFVAFTYQASDTDVVAGADGKKIIPAGTVFPTNDADAIGITLNEADVTNGDVPVSVLVEGWIIEDRLPEAVDALAKPVLTKIGFKTIIE